MSRKVEGKRRRGTKGGDEQGEEHVEATLEAAIETGAERLDRTWSQLVGTGLVGGVDVAFGVLALLLIHTATGSDLLAAFGLGIGFIALTLGASELFTENFLLPVTAVVAKRSPAVSLARLWSATAAANLAGGLVITGLFATSLPDIEASAHELAHHYVELGFGWDSFALAVLGGAAITLMTWMQRGTSTEFARVVAALGTAFLLVGAGLEHSIVVSLQMFAALWTDAPFGWLDWFTIFWWSAMGNLVGGVGLVTMLRLVQAGPEKVRFERRLGDGPS